MMQVHPSVHSGAAATTPAAAAIRHADDGPPPITSVRYYFFEKCFPLESSFSAGARRTHPVSSCSRAQKS